MIKSIDAILRRMLTAQSGTEILKSTESRESIIQKILENFEDGYGLGFISGGGVSDHGALTGLSDNDHPQYLLAASIPAGVVEEGTTNGDIKVWDEDAQEFVTVPVTGDISITKTGVTTISNPATIVDPNADRLMKWDDSEGQLVEAIPGVDYVPPLAVALKSGDYTIGTDNPNELYNGLIIVSGAATITIPAVVAHMMFTVITVGAVAVSVDPNAADRLVLDGVALSDGDKITNLSTAGDSASFAYESASGLIALTNGWTDTN